MPKDKPYLGVLLMLGFCVLAPCGDATAKLLGASVPLGEVLLVRFAVQAVILAPLCLVAGLTLRPSRHLTGWIAVRTVLHIAGVWSMFLSLQYLPLADAVAIAFVMPFILLAFARLFLGEAVGLRRMSACLVGFIGTLLVVQPSFEEVGYPALLPLLVALFFAAFMLVTRKIAGSIDAVSMQAVSGAMATVILGLMVAAGVSFGPLQAAFAPGPRELALLGLLGLIGTSAHLLMTWSLRFAPSSTVAPMQYLEIPMATLVGWLVFADLPNGMAALGIVITIAAGLYVIQHERRLARAAPGVPT